MALMRNWPKIAFLSLAVVYCETGDTGTRHDQWCTPCPEQLASDEKQSNGRFLGQPSTVAGQVNGVDRRRDISSADHVLPRSSHSAIPRAGQRSEGTSIYHRAVGCSWLHLRRRCSGSLADGATVNGLWRLWTVTRRLRCSDILIYCSQPTTDQLCYIYTTGDNTTFVMLRARDQMQYILAMSALRHRNLNGIWTSYSFSMQSFHIHKKIPLIYLYS